MTFKLRPYQQAAHDAVMRWITSSIDPCIVDAAPAAGKSFMIAAIAKTIHSRTGKKVLCLAPSAELVKQNREKYLMSGAQASMFSATAGTKDLRHPVVFGTPLTVKNRIGRFLHEFALVVVDEAHGMTPTIKGIIDAMRDANPNLRIVGFSGTPFRLGTGYVYSIDENGKTNPPETSKDPYFMKCVKRVSAREMLNGGFICPMDISETGSENYDTENLVADRMGRFDADAVDRAYHGHGRKTSAIVADIVARTAGQYGGVMLFAATVQHAGEVLASLPPEISAIVTGNAAMCMGGRINGRNEVVAAYREQRFKYLVSVGTLTTGFDVEHTSTIATLRKTESVSLLQQILGRAWRVDPKKPRSFWLDYAGNDIHFPDNDIYAPLVRVTAKDPSGAKMVVICPDCDLDQEVTPNGEYVDYETNAAGYILDLNGKVVDDDNGPIAAHYGRRCVNLIRTPPSGEHVRCDYRWTFKACPHCNAENDIAARYCHECKGEIIDPNENLAMEYKARKRDVFQMQTDEVLDMATSEGVSQAGNPTLRVDWTVTGRRFSTWFMPDAKFAKARIAYDEFGIATNDGPPKTVTYRKMNSGFFEIYNYNMEPDHAPKPA